MNYFIVYYCMDALSLWLPKVLADVVVKYNMELKPYQMTAADFARDRKNIQQYVWLLLTNSHAEFAFMLEQQWFIDYVEHFIERLHQDVKQGYVLQKVDIRWRLAEF